MPLLLTETKHYLLITPCHDCDLIKREFLFHLCLFCCENKKKVETILFKQEHIHAFIIIMRRNIDYTANEADAIFVGIWFQPFRDATISFSGCWKSFVSRDLIGCIVMEQD